MKRKVAIAVVLALLLLAVWLLATPAPIDPAVFEPGPGLAMIGAWQQNRELQRASLLGEGRLPGPESVEVDAEGRIYGGTSDGRILRIVLDVIGEEAIETYADTGGRPLGLQFAADGRLIVADGVRGLLSIGDDAQVEVLTRSAGRRPFRFTNDLDIAADGVIYFSDASSRFGPDEYLYDLLEARPHGRLLAYDPASRETRVLLDDLYFANGVALSRAEDFLLVAETYRYRIRRYWLRGPRAGEAEVFIDDLPGFPDGIAADRNGTFWVAMFTVRNPLLDRLHPLPWAKRALSKLPKLLWPKPKPYGLAVALDEEGRVLRSLHDPEGSLVREVTSAVPRGGDLYIGTLHDARIARYPLGSP
jgi:sugar lactone lactonase YvrE